MSRVLRSNTTVNTEDSIINSAYPRRSKRLSCIAPARVQSLTKSRYSTQTQRPAALVNTPVVEPENTTANENLDEAKINDCELHQEEAIIGRHKERALVSDFIRSCLTDNKSASLYISGAPGTGKTAVILHETQSFSKAGLFDLVFINCMQLCIGSKIYSKIHASLQSKTRIKCTGSFEDASSLESYLNQYFHNRRILLVLDEIDQLSSRSQDFLYRIFDWPIKLLCPIVIIGIANALDLPERLLPRLASKSHQPTHIAFPPYSRAELSSIISLRLSRLENENLDPLAIQLCAAKISAATGDVRAALNICRRAIDLSHQENGTFQFGLSKVLSSETTDLQESKRSVSTPTIHHINLALKQSQVGSIQFSSSPLPSSVSNKAELPLHHKLVLASCMLLRRQKNLREIPFTKLYETYSLVCTKKQITALEESEVSSVCSLMDSRGFVQFSCPRTSFGVKLGTPARLRSVRLRLDDNGVEQALMDDLLLSTIMKMVL